MAIGEYVGKTIWDIEEEKLEQRGELPPPWFWSERFLFDHNYLPSVDPDAKVASYLIWDKSSLITAMSDIILRAPTKEVGRDKAAKFWLFVMQHADAQKALKQFGNGIITKNDLPL